MASLDDFFAKKDKSKKGKKNKLTPEELAKQLENQGSGYHHRKKDDDYGHRSSDLISNSKLFDQNDEEWKDFEDDREKDYRGLKIVSLNIKDKEEEMLEKQRALQEKNNEKSKDDSGPWNKRADSPATVIEESKSEPQLEVAQEEIKKEDKSGLGSSGGGGIGGGSRYVPPALRHAPSGGSSGDSAIKPTTMAAALRRLPKDVLPKINDAQDFPSLANC